MCFAGNINQGDGGTDGLEETGQNSKTGGCPIIIEQLEMGIRKTSPTTREYSEIFIVDSRTEFLTLSIPPIGNQIAADDGRGAWVSLSAVTSSFAPLTGRIIATVTMKLKGKIVMTSHFPTRLIHRP